MSDVNAAVRDFLACDVIAVAGVSRGGELPANLIYRRLKETGHRVVALNPSAQEVEGAPCYPGLASAPWPVEAMVIAAPPEAAPALVRDCVRHGVQRVWMHRSFGAGSVSDEAVALCRDAGLQVIVGGCPMMYCGKVDPVHRCMRWILEVRGRIQGVGSAGRD